MLFLFIINSVERDFLLLARSERRVIQYHVFGIAYGEVGAEIAACKTVFFAVGQIFFVYLFKSAVIEVNVFQLAIGSSRKEWEFKSARVNVIEVKRLNGRAGGGLFIENLHLDGIAVNAVHDNVGKIQVFDKSGLSALVGYSGIAEVGNKYAYAARSVRHDQVGEGAVSDGSVAQPAYPDAAGVTCKRAVGDGNSFANLVLGQRVIVGAYHYAVVAANYVAVGHKTFLEQFMCMPSLLGYCTSASIFNRSKKTSSQSLTQYDQPDG